MKYSALLAMVLAGTAVSVVLATETADVCVVGGGREAAGLHA